MSIPFADREEIRKYIESIADLLESGSLAAADVGNNQMLPIALAFSQAISLKRIADILEHNYGKG